MPATSVTHARPAVPAESTPERLADGLQPGSGAKAAATLALAVIVLSSGASVMSFEFLAVRIMQRFFGSALETWAAEIAVVLVALALGYALGGWIADRFRSWYFLGAILIWSGLWGYPLEPFIESAANAVAAETTVRWWEPLVVAGASSFFLFLGLGTVMPQAMRLYIRDIRNVGKATGWIGAVSTIGSIIGVLAASYFLIPRFGVREAIYANSTFLVILGGLVLLIAWAVSWKAKRAVAGVLALLMPATAVADVIYERYSAYHHILVVDTAVKRTIYFDEDPQTIMNLDDPTSGGFEYTEYFHLPYVFNPDTDSALFIGLGGGTGPKVFLRDHPKTEMTAVEIDPMVVEVAREYFFLPEDPRLQVATMDGRVFMQRSKKKYDTIILDAYGSGPKGAYLPYHLATKEFFELALDRLEDHGSLVYNVMGSYGGINDDIVRGMMVTMEQVFPAVYAFKAKTSANTVFVAVKAAETESDGASATWPDGPWTKHPLTAGDMSRLVSRIRAEGMNLPPDFENRVQQISDVQGAPRSGQVFTDNYAPVDLGPGMRK